MNRAKLKLTLAFLAVLIAGGPALAVQYLKQSTAVVVQFGPLVDKADAVTLKTGLVSALDHATTGIMLSKNGGTLAVRHATVTASTYDAYGNYKVTLDTTDTGTLGTLRMQYTDATTCLPVWRDFVVVPANTYDSLIGNTDSLNVNTMKVGPAGSGTAQTAGDIPGKTNSLTFTVANEVNSNARYLGGSTTPITNLGTVFNTDYVTNYDATNHFWNTNFAQALPSNPVANSFGEAMFLADIQGGRIGTAQATPTTSGSVVLTDKLRLDSGASSDSLSYVGDSVFLYGGTGGGIRGTGQRRTITAYDGSTKIATVDRPWVTVPDNTSKFMILPAPLANVGLIAGLPTPGRDGSIPVFNRGHLSRVAHPMPWAGSNSGHTIYVRAAGSDSNGGTDPTSDAYATVQKAIDEINTNAYSDAKIDWTGAQSIGTNSWRIPANCWLAGDGTTTITRDANGLITNITWSGTSTVTGSATTTCVVSAANNAVLTGFQVTASNIAGAPIGCKSAQLASSGVIVGNVETIGDADGAYLNPTAPNNGSWRYYSSKFNYKWDGAVIIGEGATATVDYYNCFWNWLGNSANPSVDTRAITGTGGTQRCFGCAPSAPGRQTSQLAYAALARLNAHIELYGGSASGLDYDVAQQDRGVMSVYGVTYTGNTLGNVIDGDPGLDWSKVRKPTATKALTATTIGTLTTYTGNTPQTADNNTLLVAVNAKTTNLPASPAAVGSAMTLTSGERTTLADSIHNDSLSNNTTAGTAGRALSDAGSAGNPWASLLAGNAISGSFGERVQALPLTGTGDWTTTQKAQILASLSVGQNIGVPKNLIWVISRKDGDVKPNATISKKAAEGADVAADFRNLFGTSDAIQSITSVTLVSGTLASPAFTDVTQATLWMASAVRFHVTGGTAGASSVVRITVLTVGGNTYSADCEMVVK